jgi:hypothetical protein
MSVKPALTPEEWQERQEYDPAHGDWGHEDCEVCELARRWFAGASPAERHAAAARALHGQPFGFTWEMVDLLRKIADEMHEAINAGADAPMVSETGVDVGTIADRIAALLPPRET